MLSLTTAPCVIKAWGSRFYAWFSFLLFPAFCTYCKDVLSARVAFCTSCADLIEPVASKKLVITQKYQMQIFTVGVYQEPLKQLVLAKTYGDILACSYMAELMHAQITAQQLRADYLVPIPLHWSRYAKRGYNQSEEIAKQLARSMGIPVLHLLKRTKRTPFQSRFDQVGRHANVQDAFQLNVTQDDAKQLLYKRFILVDDVMTTGATLHAAGRILLALKPLSLSAVALARTK